MHQKKFLPCFILPAKITSTCFQSKMSRCNFGGMIIFPPKLHLLVLSRCKFGGIIILPTKITFGANHVKISFFRPSKNNIWVLRSSQLSSIGIAWRFGSIILISKFFAMGSKLQFVCSFSSNQFYVCKLASVLSSQLLFCALIILTFIMAFFFVHMY